MNYSEQTEWLRKHGGPFHPIGAKIGEMEVLHAGLSLRDWFAGQALIGVFSNPRIDEQKNVFELAQLAYHTADAMLAAMEKK